jgi:small subunit ribosomal protein S20
VANEKKAVLRASRPPPLRPSLSPTSSACASEPGGAAGATDWRSSAATSALDYAAAAPGPGHARLTAFMANIASQEKRIRRAERERVENRRYTSQVKTYFRRLEAAVAAGDASQADTEHRALSSCIDHAVTRGALHRNAAARKKSRAVRIRARL